MAKATPDPALAALLGAILDRTSAQLRDLTAAGASPTAGGAAGRAEKLPAPAAAFGKQLASEAAALAKQTTAVKNVALDDLARLVGVATSGTQIQKES